MALKTMRVCDLCDQAGTEVRLSVDGTTVTVDLCPLHKGELDVFVQAGGSKKEKTALPKVEFKTAPKKAKVTAPDTVDYTPTAVREWASTQGMDYPKRGPIPAELLMAYRKAVQN